MHRPYRLLQISNRTLGGGGEDLAVQLIARNLAPGCQFEEVIFQSADWIGSNAPPVWKQAAWTFYNPHSIRLIREAQQRLKADAWILHNFVPVVSAGVYHEALRQRTPIIQYLHNFRPFSVSSYVSNEQNGDPAHWPKNFLREIRHGSWQDSRLKTAFLASVLTWLHLTNQYRAVRAWITVSDFMREKFMTAGIASENIFRLYHPWTLKNSAPQVSEEDYYLFLGRLIEEKGVKVLIRAWDILREKAEVHTSRLVIAGDGPLRDFVKAAAAANPHIEFRGFVSGEEKHKLLTQCRAVIQPSICWEALSLVIYESYDYGKPVLAAASGGMTELVQPGRTGFQHQPGNFEQLANHVLELDSAAPQSRRQMGQAGREWLIANASDEIWRKQFFTIVDYAVAGAKQAGRSDSPV
jgi:glycosyltransferase involved in cell wall biosynthesis